jgi:hypothetical protein
MDFSFHYKTFKRTIEAVWFFFLKFIVHYQIIKLIGAYNFFLKFFFIVLFYYNQVD